MSRTGIRFKIDVTKIDKTKLVQGKKGTYLDVSCFFDPDDPSEYGDHGMVVQDVSKQEKDAGVKGAILGNATVFWQEGAAPVQANINAAQPQNVAALQTPHDDIPF